jgi:hypothetical protein
MFLIMMGRIHRDSSEEESMILIETNVIFLLSMEMMMCSVVVKILLVDLLKKKIYKNDSVFNSLTNVELIENKLKLLDYQMEQVQHQNLRYKYHIKSS